MLMSAAEAMLELAPDPTSPMKARVFLAMTLHEWGCDDVGDVAALLVSEVVTNAVEHVQSTALLTASYDQGRVEVRVQDESDALPLLQRSDPEAEAGRGLMLLNALADQWGIEPLAGGGKSVYFALDC
jgi:anti-sigma regulatory factor (Ser/Thr protein kinase)